VSTATCDIRFSLQNRYAEDSLVNLLTGLGISNRAVTISGRAAGSGRPGESHPRAPMERSVTVSCHSARAVLIIRGCLTHAQWAK
jgi:hypothetical protein